LNSNFSWKYDDRLLDILDSLENDAIVISCDGFSQEVCEQYRVGVNFDLVMHNIELISRHRKPQTKVKWQYLGFPWNHAEEKAAADYCQSRHIDFHLGRGGVTPNYPMLPSRRVPKEEQSRCDVFRGSLTINFDGEIYPCCMYYGPATYSLGNASKTSVQKIFSRGKGKAMLDYLTVQSPGNDAIFCKHCVERDTGLVESWK
jgi:radical SAM protein with 4Fe4S-binding SPASM domain